MVLISSELNVTYQGQAPTSLKMGMYAYGPAKAVLQGECISQTACILAIVFEAPVDAHEHKSSALGVNNVIDLL
ncbi:hypothetical protein [Vibrio sp. DNB22_12_1]